MNKIREARKAAGLSQRRIGSLTAKVSKNRCKP